MKNTITTSVSSLQLDEHNIVHMTFLKNNSEISLSDSREIYEGRIQLPCSEKKQLLLVDMRSNPKPDKEARDFAKSPEVVNSTRAMAILVGGPMSRIIGNFFIGFNRGDFPVQLFTNKDKAISWLLDSSENG